MGTAALRQSIVEYAIGIAKSVAFWAVVLPTTALGAWELYIVPRFPVVRDWPLRMTPELFLVLVGIGILVGGFSAYHRLRTAERPADAPVIRLTPGGGVTISGEHSEETIETLTTGWVSRTTSTPPARRSRTSTPPPSSETAASTLWDDSSGGS